MTHKEYTEFLYKTRQEYNHALRAYTEKLRKEESMKIASKNAEMVATINELNIEEGDVIHMDGVYIRVTEIQYCYDTYECNCYLMINGVQLTKKLEVRKVQEHTFIQQRYGKFPDIVRKHE